MELIIEGGATKTDYCLAGDGGLFRFQSSGINLATMDKDTVSLTVRDAVSHLNAVSGASAEDVGSVHFYCAGLLDERRAADILKEVFPAADVRCGSDLLAAARAVCGRQPGIAAILGTGSNSCLYDGESVLDNVKPCGYILGDFGSGAALGKMFLADYLQDLMPVKLSAAFMSVSGVDYSSAVAAVYKGGSAATYLASFAPYIVSVARGKEPSVGEDAACRGYAMSLVRENFRTFFRRCVRQYGRAGLPVGVAGSFGYACSDILREIAAENDMKISTCIASPMEGLIKYHIGC